MIIPVHTSIRNYDIFLESDGLKNANTHLDLTKKVLIVTDNGVPLSYVEELAMQCNNPTIITIQQGEYSKNLREWNNIINTLLKNDFTRDDTVVAIGGGVVGDLAGFAASAYMRGIRFYNIPTTLLSMVDSSIGGKTAVDIDNVKNVVGAFYPPFGVLIDPTLLTTLDIRQFSSGMAEVIKMASTFDPELFALIEDTTDIHSNIEEIIYKSLLIKKRVVEEDEHDNGIRRVLNFGHTIGHAIESASQGGYLHGECVALGMLPMSNGTARVRIRNLLEQYNLKTDISIDTNLLMNYLIHDKKAKGEMLNVITCPNIGEYEIKKIKIADFKTLLEESPWNMD